MAGPASREEDRQHKVSGSSSVPSERTAGGRLISARAKLTVCYVSLHARAAVEDDWLNLHWGMGLSCYESFCSFLDARSYGLSQLTDRSSLG